ncbi:TrkH family potassium uptake protein [Synechocystis sp. LKSZ1]|uniref:TrkH family potassium uptake protein n=1 Tax=Synechocystis sp. LKSZ1 TaxID=3144951 RepID=UPI00336BECAA
MTISRSICLGFLAVILVGALLLTMPFATTTGTWGNFLVALFTSTSAVCVTGLSVVDPNTYFSFWGELILVLLVQVGGLGYMTVTTFLMLLIGRKFDLQQKFAIQESFDRPFLQGSRNLIKSIFATTLLFELTGAFFLTYKFSQDHPLQESLWLGLFHSVSAFNNAGFSLFKDSLMGYHDSIIINFVITGLIIFGGIGYQVIIECYFWLEGLRLRSKQKFSFSLNFKVVVKFTLFLLFLGTIAFLLIESQNPETLGPMGWQDKLLAAWFQSVTTRTAGFNTVDNGKLEINSLLITMILMFVGASPSGTGGGIKTTTLSILTNCTRSVLRGQETIVIYKRTIPNTLVFKAIAVTFGSLVTVIIATSLITFIEQKINSSLEAVPILFEVVSAFGTVGLSMGITASLTPLSQLVIIATMYIGRVGVILLMAAIVGDPKPSMLHHPEENLLVG